MTSIVNISRELQKLGSSNPSGAWSMIKSKEPALSLLALVDDEGKEYINREGLVYLRSVYQRLFEEAPSLAQLDQTGIVVAGRGFQSADELRGYLTAILKKYTPGQSLTGFDKEFLADLLCRNSKIKEEVARYGCVVDLMVDIKVGHKSPAFHILYSNGKKQNISMINYLNPNKVKLVNIWDTNWHVA
jgi:hypothetical protein